MDKDVGVYKGWIVVGASFVTYMVVWGGAWYSFSVFLNIFVRDFQWGRGEVAGVFSICVSIIFLSAPLVGRAFDYFGPKYIMPVAAMFLGANLFLCTRINSLFDFYLYYGIGCGTGMSFLLFTAQAPIITRWFHIHRATAMGLSLSGGGIGMMVFVPLIQRCKVRRSFSVSSMFPIRVPFNTSIVEKLFLYPSLRYPMKASRRNPLPSLPAFPCGLCSLWGDSEGGQKDVYARLSPDLSFSGEFQ